MSEPRAERPYMPDYGVDDAEWRPLPWSWAAERLAANQNFWVVTVSAAGRPHALPVWGVWDDERHCFGFSCGQRARKARNLAANPQAVVMTESTVECLSVEGRADRVEEKTVLDRWVGKYLERYKPISPDLTAEFVGGGLFFEVSAERAFAVIERAEDFSTRATRWVFT